MLSSGGCVKVLIRILFMMYLVYGGIFLVLLDIVIDGVCLVIVVTVMVGSFGVVVDVN